MVDKEELKTQAMEIREQYLAGKITFKEAKKLLKEYEKYYNQVSAEIAAKYNQKPYKFSVGEFLKVGLLR